jgi:hypothetical protein
MRRFIWINNAFSLKFELLEAAGVLSALHQNFTQIHQMLRIGQMLEERVRRHARTWEKGLVMAERDAT